MTAFGSRVQQWSAIRADFQVVLPVQAGLQRAEAGVEIPTIHNAE